MSEDSTTGLIERGLANGLELDTEEFGRREEPGAHIEICTHCYRYSRLLAYQLSSLVLHPPKNVIVQLTVFCTPEDERTLEMIAWFMTHKDIPETVWLRQWPLEHDNLMRRAIGRNLLARETSAEIVWFADCDMVFGEGCLDALYEQYAWEETLTFPRVVRKSGGGYAVGDRLIEAVNGPGLYEIDPAEFEPVQHDRAIGGIQIVKGTTANRHGYLPGTRWQQPATTWQRTFEDPVYRKTLAAGRGTPIDVPGVYRLRHSRYGREHTECEN